MNFARVTAWDNLLLAWRKAALGKRGKYSVAAFEHRVADRLLALKDALEAGAWRPGKYVHFYSTSTSPSAAESAPRRSATASCTTRSAT